MKKNILIALVLIFGMIFFIIFGASLMAFFKGANLCSPYFYEKRANYKRYLERISDIENILRITKDEKRAKFLSAELNTARSKCVNSALDYNYKSKVTEEEKLNSCGLPFVLLTTYCYE